MTTKSLAIALVLILASTSTLLAEGRVADIRQFGAVPDGKTLNTEPIQAAIDDRAEAGGGTVYFPPGRWLTGTIFLKDNITLQLEAGATLLGSAEAEHYPENLPKIRSYTDKYVRQSLIAGEGLHNIALRGRGTIDGQGEEFPWKEWVDRPFLIRLVDCRDVLVEGVHLRDSAMWMQHYLACERVRINGITVFNHSARNNDGIDIDGCRNVVISDCIFDTDDDALCLKSTLPRPSENVTITNCVLSSHCNALKMGTESTGGFRNITISNCTIRSPRYSEKIYGLQRGISGISLETVDGGRLEGVTITNVTIEGVAVPIFLRLGNRARPHKPDAAPPPVGVLRNVMLNNIVATGTGPIGCAIAGIPGHPIENVTLSNIQLEFEGGGTTDDAARTVPEKEDSYPEATMFGRLPAYGIYARHVRGLRLNNVQLTTQAPDARPPLAFDHAEDVLVDGAKPQGQGTSR